MWHRFVGVGAAAIVLAEMALHDAAHAYYWWHRLPGFDLAYGLAGGTLLVAASKALGAWLRRTDHYYDTEPGR